MIKFEKIRCKNFLSVGNVWNEYQLDQGLITLITGKNGAGKSTLIDALYFAIYGKAHRDTNKETLVNWTNEREAVVELWLNVDGVAWFIRRGIKPNVFDITQDGKPVAKQGSMNELQSWLEQNVIKMSLATFSQVVVLASADYIPFMKLKAAERRNVVDNLLDVKIFTLMRAQLKALNDQLNLDIFKSNQELRLLEGQIETQEQYIRKLEDNSKGEVDRLQVKLDKLKADASILQTQIKEKKAELPEKPVFDDTALITASVKRSSIVGEIARLTESIAKLSGQCSECGQPLVGKHFEEQKAKLDGRLNEEMYLETRAAEELSSLQQLKANHDRALTAYNDVNNSIMALSIKLRAMGGSGVELTTQLKALKASRGVEQEDFERLAALRQSKVDKEKEIASHKKLSVTYELAAILLKDNGIKAQVIKRYVATINKCINKYLEVFSFPINFVFDENFEDTIRIRGKDDYSYHSLSMGQRMRVDLALLLTWREVTKMRSMIDTNLLIFDEVFDGSLDADGASDLMDAFSTFNNTSIFIISHRGEQLAEKIERHIHVTLDGGFSKLQIS